MDWIPGAPNPVRRDPGLRVTHMVAPDIPRIYSEYYSEYGVRGLGFRPSL